jgi:hypothetical protein
MTFCVIFEYFCIKININKENTIGNLYQIFPVYLFFFFYLLYVLNNSLKFIKKHTLRKSRNSNNSNNLNNSNFSLNKRLLTLHTSESNNWYDKFMVLLLDAILCISLILFIWVFTLIIQSANSEIFLNQNQKLIKSK